VERTQGHIAGFANPAALAVAVKRADLRNVLTGAAVLAWAVLTIYSKSDSELHSER